MILNKIANLIAARASLVYLVSQEEERVERLVKTAAVKVFGEAAGVYVWSCTTGITKGDAVVDGATRPHEALSSYLSIKDENPLVFKDLHLFVKDNPHLIRQLKEAARVLRKSRKVVFFVCPQLSLPEELFTVFKVLDIPLPRYDELSKVLDACIQAEPKAESLKKSLSPDLRNKMVRGAQGFTSQEAVDAFRGALMNQDEVTDKSVDLVLDEKEALVRKGGVLEYVSQETGTWEIGGLDNLKRWLSERGQAFSPDAAKRGLTPPKGILVMGVSGCGKSLCVKAVASYWKLPLLRLDMGRIYDGIAGPPEEAMRKAIVTSEAVAPCVLWIDEIEAGIANQQKKAGGGEEARVLALFLTWMQEKSSAVFVGATANEVEVLPPEVLRKGRFDELFYMGLPSREERKQIITIHMKKRGVEPSRYDMNYLAESTEGLNGAEIEEAVISAIYEGLTAKQEVSEHMLANCFRNIVPLSRTMRERIQKIEAWARDRAMKASLSDFEGAN
jgi:SpoVK/Ycf46/Vps4 family AAA+-type ATPase